MDRGQINFMLLLKNIDDEIDKIHKTLIQYTGTNDIIALLNKLIKNRSLIKERMLECREQIEKSLILINTNKLLNNCKIDIDLIRPPQYILGYWYSPSIIYINGSLF